MAPIWPGSGPCSDARPDVHWSPAEALAVIAWHREAAALETAKEQLLTPTAQSEEREGRTGITKITLYILQLHFKKT